MKTSVNIPSDLIERVKEYNRKNPGLKIVMSGVCRAAIEEKLLQVEEKVHPPVRVFPSTETELFTK